MFFTFYSFRGGQGQSLALANAALSLSMRGLRVLLVDMSFASPSLPRLVGLQVGRERGLIDMIEDHLQGMGSDAPLSSHLLAVPPTREMTGEILLLPAGGRRGGAARRAPDIPWASFYQEHEGYRFFENLKGEIRAVIRPDLVLIDGGAGPGDPAGIAVLQLAEALVVVCGPSNVAVEALAAGTEHLPAEGPNIRGPRERLVVLSPMPAASEEAVERALKAAARAGGALEATAIPYAPTQAWTADGRLVLARPGEPVCQAYRALAHWLDGSGLEAGAFRVRIEGQANRPQNVIGLLSRVESPQPEVLEAFREALIQEAGIRVSGEPLARRVARSAVPFRWRVAAAQALLEIEGLKGSAEGEDDPLRDALALHQVRYLPRARLSREAEGLALMTLAGRVSGVLGAETLMSAVQSLMHRGGDVPAEACLAVSSSVVAEGTTSTGAAAVRLATHLPRRSHEAVVAWLEGLGYHEGMDVEALIDAVVAVGQNHPARAARCLARLWTGTVGSGFPHRAALAALRQLLESAPGELAPLLVEEGANLLARDFEHGWKESQGRTALWYVLAPAHQGSALIGLVEDALSHWLVMGDRRSNTIIEGLMGSERSVSRWVLLGALPLAPAKLRRRLIGALCVGFHFPPPGAERRWDATGVIWPEGQGSGAPAADPVARTLVEDMARSGLRPPMAPRAQAMLANLAAHPELPKGLVLAVIHHALSCEEQLPIPARRPAEELIFAALPQVVAVEAMISLVRHRGTTPALTVALNQLIEEREGGAAAVARGLTSLAETQFDLAVSLAEKFLEVRPTAESWAGLLKLVEGRAGRRNNLLELVMRALAESPELASGALPDTGLDALEGATLATIVGGRRASIRAAEQVLTHPRLPQWSRRRICRSLAGRLGVGLEGRRAERLLGRLIDHDGVEVRSAAALAIVHGALDSSPQTSLQDDMLARLAEEAERRRPALDVILALLTYLSEWSGDLSENTIKLLKKVQLAVSPAMAEPRLASLAEGVLVRILRAAQLPPKHLEDARRLLDALREGGVARQE